MFGNETEKWKKEALRLASEKPYEHGRLKEIHEKITQRFGEQISYDMVRFFLVDNGFRTHKRPKAKKSLKNVDAESFSYALVKLDNHGKRLRGQGMKISNEEAISLMEKRVF